MLGLFTQQCLTEHVNKLVYFFHITDIFICEALNNLIANQTFSFPVDSSKNHNHKYLFNMLISIETAAQIVEY